MIDEGAGIRRPRLAQAPPRVRLAVREMLGGPVVAEQAADAGFTPSIASVVTGGDGRRLFVKAAPVGDGLGEAVTAGVVLAGVTGPVGPRLVGCASAGRWRVAAYEVVDGTAVTCWRAADLPHLLRVVDRLRKIAQPCPVVGVTPYAEAFVPLLGTWRALNGEGDGGVAVDHLRGRPLPVELPIPLLAGLEGDWLDALAAGTALHHGDLRRDNVIREPGGRLRIVDWTHLWTAPGWLDLVRLGPDLAICGHDPERMLRRSCWRDAPADAVDVALAGLAGRAWREGWLPPVPGLPGLRRMQRRQGLHLLRWLAARRRRTLPPPLAQ
ncbi:aminoglycoside phosphotransferase [Actinoplanes sp. SE50]|uniref:aminoglycoside phosphotransferase n=1 Tax=unclassified Actinoplanes TaxID=2626549 RepID=UPI00023EC491|nr:aminoglycoside phosphotransferase [Actinoplanes sp. SE50/110]ATO83648.1 aminoglycoside phosphotransferase [Actinoplanes sp. SE50]SLM01056.1 aminoglycoside phosphotransferase [Actinoplanes sp. SE50/110]